MKKLLAMLVVLSLATVANAALIDVSSRDIGQSDGRTGTIEDPLYYSDTIELVISTSVGLDGYGLDLHVTGPGILGEVNGGPPANHVNASGDFFWLYSGISAGEQDIDLMSDAGFPAGIPAGDLVWGITLHCDGPGEVIVDLTLADLTRITATGEYATPEDLGSLVIYQIPEPITMIMLGLGGLGMLRRRR